MTDATTGNPPPPTEAVTHPVEPAPKRRWYAPLFAGDLAALWPAIVVAFLAVLVIAFAMSYHGLFVLGERIMRWPLGLCVMAPVGLDVFSLVALLATFLTRDAHWRVRLYCWVALLFTVALSIGGNAISAFWLLDHVATLAGATFQWGYAQVSAVAFAAVWPALAAVALHVLIVVRRHLDSLRDKVNTVAEQAKAEEAAELLLQARALVIAATGATAADIRKELELPPEKQRSVERWTEPIRRVLAEPRTAVAAKSTTSRRTTSVRTDGRSD